MPRVPCPPLPTASVVGRRGTRTLLALVLIRIILKPINLSVSCASIGRYMGSRTTTKTKQMPKGIILFLCRGWDSNPQAREGTWS